MKGKDNGIFDTTKENSEKELFPKEIENKFDIQHKIAPKKSPIFNQNSQDQNNQPTESSNKLEEDLNMLNNKNKIKINKKVKLKVIQNDNIKKENKNGINKIDFGKNLIILNKKNLKEVNDINKKNQNTQKKGETINIFGSNRFYYTNKDISNTINKSYDIYTKKLENSYEKSGMIKYNMKFPNEVIEKFFERKKSKKKENKDSGNNYFMTSFGTNPLERLKEIQERLNDAPPTTKGNKISVKQFKTNQKKLKEEDSQIQNYIKLFPVFNCPEHKIFKINQFYYYNRIYEDKNNFYNKKRNNINNKNKNKEEAEKVENESEEDTIKRHIKKKFINKKRYKSKNKENKSTCEV